MKCICIRGYPGQGKSAFTRSVFPDLFHVENDMWHMKDGKYKFNARNQDKAIAWCLDMCEHALAEGMDCIVSNTFTKFGYVEAYRKLAEKYGAEFVVYRMRGEFKNTHNVPENVLRNMKEKFVDYPGEIYVYPNLNQDSADPAYVPYMFTNLKAGDKVVVKRFKSRMPELTLAYGSDGPVYGNGFDMEDCQATISGISQGTYGYLNVSYTEDDTGESGICMTGDCCKIEN